MVSRQIITQSGPGDTPPHEHDASEVSGTFGFLRALKAVIDGDVRVTGDIRSSNYEQGVSGWKLNSDGSFELNGQLTVPDGSAAEPGIATLGDMDTGLFFGGSSIGFSVDGTEAGRIVAGQIRMNPGTLAKPSYSFGAGTVTTRAVAVAALSPVAWWRFTGDPGTADSSSAGTHALTFSGTPTLEQTGAWTSDEAVTFDGTDDRATVANESDVERESSDRSWEIWCKPDADNVVDSVVSIINAAGTNLLVNVYWQGENMGVRGGTTGQQTLVPAASGEWHHVVVSDNVGASTTERNVYLDGDLVDSLSFANPSDTWTVVIGALSTLPSFLFNGSISEIAVYPSALSASEANALYHAQSETAQPGITSGLFYDATNDDLAVSLTGSEVARIR